MHIAEFNEHLDFTTTQQWNATILGQGLKLCVSEIDVLLTEHWISLYSQSDGFQEVAFVEAQRLM